MAERYLLEDGSGYYLLEDGSGAYLMQPTGELIVNGDAQTGDFSSWSSVDSATGAVVGGQFQVTGVVATSRYVQAVTTIVGAVYFYEATVTNGTATAALRIGTTDGGGQYTVVSAPGGTGSFTATTTTTYFSMINDAGTGLYDNISLVMQPTLLPALFTNSQVFPTPTVVPGAITLSPSLHSDGDTFQTASITLVSTLSPSLYADGDTFFAPTVTRGTVTLTPSLYSDADTFFAPTVTRGTVTLSPSLVTDADTIFAPTVTPGTITLVPSLYANAQAFQSLTVTAGAVTLVPPLVTDADTFFGPTVTTSYALQAGLVANGQSFYGPTVSQLGSSQDLFPSLFATSPVFHAPQVLSTAGGGAPAKPKVSAFFFRQ